MATALSSSCNCRGQSELFIILLISQSLNRSVKIQYVSESVLLSRRRWCTSTRGSIWRSSCLTRTPTKTTSWGGECRYDFRGAAPSLRTPGGAAPPLFCRLRCRAPRTNQSLEAGFFFFSPSPLLKGVGDHKAGAATLHSSEPEGKTQLILFIHFCLGL